MQSTTPFKTAFLDSQTDMFSRIDQLRSWRQDYQQHATYIQDRIDELFAARATANRSQRNYLEKRINQLQMLRKRMRLLQIREPFVMKSRDERESFNVIFDHLAPQYAQMTQEDRLLLLTNLLLIRTPDVKRLTTKLDELRRYQASGQPRGLLVGGESGTGKTSALDWYTVHNFPQVLDEITQHSVIAVEPLRDDSSPKSLPAQIILATGDTHIGDDSLSNLLHRAMAILAYCRTQLLIVEEVDFLQTAAQREQLITLSNLTDGPSMACSAVFPERFRSSHPALAGRFRDQVRMKPYTGQRLMGLLALIELLLPFSQPSYLSPSALHVAGEGGKAETVDGICKFIEAKTGGKLREVMLLIRDASTTAILENLPCLTIDLLEKTWSQIQSPEDEGGRL